MLIDDDATRAGWVENCLIKLGFSTSSVISQHTCSGPPTSLLRTISDQAPDVIIIDMDSPDRDLLESLSILAQHNPTPVVMFSAEEDPDYISRAVAAGVSTYLVGGIDPDKVRPIIEVAFAQFRNFQKLRQSLEDTRAELSSRRIIDRAKLTVMQRLNLSENQAYEHMRREAMNRGETLLYVAQQILNT